MAFDGSTWPGGGARVRPPAKTGKPVWSPPKVMIPPKKPGYFGPARTPKRIPFGKKVPKVKVPIRIPGWIGPALELGAAVGYFFWPGEAPDEYSWVPENPAFQPCGGGGGCAPTGPPYTLGPTFGQAFNSSCGPVDCDLVAQACPSGNSLYSGEGNLRRTAGNRPYNCISMHETRDSGGSTRCNVLQVWCVLPAPPTGSPSLDPRLKQMKPGRSPFIPHTAPAPFADFLPGVGMPYPQPIPFRELPYYPDPDNDYLPGQPAPSPQPYPQYPIVDPFPGVIDPMPWPTPVPVPAPDPGVVWPWPQPTPLPPPSPFPGLPNPDPAPVPPTVPEVVPPYYIPAVGYMLDVKPEGLTQVKPIWPYHRLTKPKQKEKEKKFRMSAAMSTLWGVTGAATEMLDLVDILYGSIPCQLKYDQGMMIRGRKVGVHAKAAFIAANVQHIDGTELLRLGSKNAFEDRFYGTLSPEKAQYQGSYQAGINNHGGKSIESNQRYRPQTNEKNPVIEAFNAGVDQILGPRPKSHSCCGGKVNTCAKVQFGQNVKLARAHGMIGGRKAQQNFWIAAKKATMYKRNAYSQVRAGYSWQPRQ